MSVLSVDLHDQPAEEAALAAALQNVAACDYLVAYVREVDFWSPDKQTVFRAIAQLRGDGKPVDATTVKSTIRANGAKAEDVRRLGDLVGHLDDVTVVAASAKMYVNAILAATVRRKVALEAQAVLDEAGAGDDGDADGLSPLGDDATAQPEPVPTQPPPIAASNDILNAVATALHRRGVAGEDRFVKVTYLCLTSRVLNRPVSLAAKGPSSAGKSFVVQEVIEFFPPSAYYALSSMSEHALAYSVEPLSHRFLVLYEQAGLESDFASYLMRSLLSEGCVRYETVEAIKGKGMVPRLIVREGPTGLVVTTTAVNLHPENETRLLSVSANDTRQQTAAVIRILAADEDNADDGEDLSEWRSLQTWIAAQDNRVAIPFALELAELVPPVAVRLRRDFATVLNMVKAHAILHQQTRARDDAGRIVATVADYGIVRELIADLIADEVGATVPSTVVETVAAVEALLVSKNAAVSYLQLGDRLRLDKSTAMRRAKVAISRGYLKNLEDHRGRAARLVIGEPLPGEVTILPTVETLSGCTVARLPEGESRNRRPQPRRGRGG